MSEFVGLAEIVEMAGEPKPTVWHWTNRDDFPKPIQELRTGRLWKRKEVEAWLKRQGN